VIPCWWLRPHDWESRAVSYWRYGERGCARTTLLEVCRRCCARRETEWHGERKLSEFRPSPPPPDAMVRDLIKSIDRPEGE